MKKKYTMEEFKEMYKLAERATLEKLKNDFNKASGGELDQMQELGFTMQNMIVVAELKNELFKEEK